jgi:nitronate monooxygenase
MKTVLTELIGCDLQAPIGRAACPALAAAVSNAGGVGMLALSGDDDESIRRKVRQTRLVTSRPFGVNLILAYPYEEQLAASLKEGVRIISFFWGDPALLVERVHAAGAVVLYGWKRRRSVPRGRLRRRHHCGAGLGGRRSCARDCGRPSARSDGS